MIYETKTSSGTIAYYNLRSLKKRKSHCILHVSFGQT